MENAERYIKPFDSNHVVYIGTLLVLIFLMVISRKKLKIHRQTADKVILIVSILQQILLYSSYFLVEGFTWGESLPLHISRVNSLLGIIYLITGNENVFRVFTHFSVFALLSFMVPVKIDPITHPFGLSFLINHAVTLLLPSYIMMTRRIKIKKADLFTSYKWFLVYFISILIINPLTDGNYFYMKEKPILKTLPDIYYIPTAAAAVFILFFIWNAFYRHLFPQDQIQD